MCPCDQLRRRSSSWSRTDSAPSRIRGGLAAAHNGPKPFGNLGLDSGGIMGLPFRLLLVDKADHIYRLDVSRFDQVRDDPKTHPPQQFAGERTRSAKAVVEIIRRIERCTK